MGANRGMKKKVFKEECELMNFDNKGLEGGRCNVTAT